MSWISFMVLSSLYMLCDTHVFRNSTVLTHTKRKTTRKMYLQWIKKSMKTKLYLLVINSPKGVPDGGKTMENTLKRQTTFCPFQLMLMLGQNNRQAW